MVKNKYVQKYLLLMVKIYSIYIFFFWDKYKDLNIVYIIVYLWLKSTQYILKWTIDILKLAYNVHTYSFL